MSLVSFRCAVVLAGWCCVVPAYAQGADNDAAPAPAERAENKVAPQPQPIDKRVFGVMPNYRTADGSLPFRPITARQKMTIAAKDSFDWPIYMVSGLFAGLYQLDDQNHSFGQGMAGYGKRYATAFGDQMIGNMFTEGIMPSLLHEDPRYFRRGVGSKKSRLVYALTRILITKTDSGRAMFNFAEVGGNSIAAAISNAYYPDTRSVHDNFEKLGVSLATDAISQVGKEFWPDIKRKLFTKHRDEESLGTR